MPLRSAAILALVAALVAPQAFAQDELFVPLTPKQGASKAKPKSKSEKRRAAKKSSAKKPSAAPVDDELVVPIGVPKTELLVRLSGGVKGARLFLDNKEKGTLPLPAFSVEPGEYTLIVRRPGFAEFSRRVTAARRKTTEVFVSLEPVAGVVAVNADVAGASVTIDGQPHGQVPLSGLLLKPGTREIVVSREGFEPETSRLAVRAGKDYTVNAHLRPTEQASPPLVASADRPQKPVLAPAEPAVRDGPQLPLSPERPAASQAQPWFKRWYVWAGVGAVAAAVGTVVVTQGGSGKALTADEVCGGPCDGTINGLIRF